ncbi:hypothetical protein SAMN04489757_102171 [Anaerocolumna aminovalerica]|uniref:Uncharacterized protein n=1 Tax=Anaerocolumna aminovalerica TaxID=1527 RepID=A0A1I5C774_9FIRM|nr:hypothetical protein SAMN04489757_102171 [Anaerocolumna aminovalerica]
MSEVLITKLSDLNNVYKEKSIELFIGSKFVIKEILQ